MRTSGLKELQLKSTARPSALINEFKQRVDFSPRPEPPIGTIVNPFDVPPATEGTFLGKMNLSETEMEVRFHHKHNGSVTAMIIRVMDGMNGGSKIEARYDFGLSRKEKIFAISMTLLFWFMIVGMIAMLGEYVDPGEVQKILGLSALFTLVVFVLTPILVRSRARAIDQPLLENLVKEVIEKAEMGDVDASFGRR